MKQVKIHAKVVLLVHINPEKVNLDVTFVLLDKIWDLGVLTIVIFADLVNMRMKKVRCGVNIANLEHLAINMDKKTVNYVQKDNMQME